MNIINFFKNYNEYYVYQSREGVSIYWKNYYDLWDKQFFLFWKYILRRLNILLVFNFKYLSKFIKFIKKINNTGKEKYTSKILENQRIIYYKSSIIL